MVGFTYVKMTKIVPILLRCDRSKQRATSKILRQVASVRPWAAVHRNFSEGAKYFVREKLELDGTWTNEGAENKKEQLKVSIV